MPTVAALRLPTGLILLGLVALSTLVRLWAARSVPAPWITPDEQTYALIGRSLYETGRFEVLGRDAGLLSVVYPALIGLPFRLFEPHTAYVVVKVFQALLMSLTAVPVYLWGRSLMSRGSALSAAALTLAVPGLAYSGFLMTEVAFYPVLCLSAWAMAHALAQPTLSNQLLLLATMLLAVATRLQAVALVPVLVVALLLKLAFDRGPIGSLRRFAPVFAGLAAVTGLWVLLTTAGGGPGNHVLGSYQVAGTTSYDPLDAARFGFYHLADLLLLSAVLPVVALALLAVRAVTGGEGSESARAFVAVAVAYTLGFAAQVGLFTSGLLGRLGERYLLALAPLLFLSLALWLDRGAPRPRLATGVISLGTLGLLLALPMSFISEGAAPDAFSTIPLYEIRRHIGAGELKLAILLAAAALLALLVAAPARRRWLLPLAAAALLIPASVSASRFVAKQARGFRLLTVGSDERWIDRFAEGPVAFVYGGEYGFSAGGPVWANLFWNRRLEAVYTLPGVRIVGPIAKQSVSIAGDGQLLSDGRSVQSSFAVGSEAISFFGARINTGAAFVLWRLDQPARISTRSSGIRLLKGDIDARARIVVYDCRAGALELQLIAPEARTITLYRNGVQYRSVTLAGGVPWSGTIPPRRRADGTCTFELLTQGGGVHAERFDFVRGP
jgi:dolichyl-phosphate-mannose-protein mannosyltransferase